MSGTTNSSELPRVRTASTPPAADGELHTATAQERHTITLVMVRDVDGTLLGFKSDDGDGGRGGHQRRSNGELDL